jgi:hypothetical protein
MSAQHLPNDGAVLPTGDLLHRPVGASEGRGRLRALEHAAVTFVLYTVLFIVLFLCDGFTQARASSLQAERERLSQILQDARGYSDIS